MPKANIYIQDEECNNESGVMIMRIYENMTKIRDYLATKLSCSETSLTPKEISVRVIKEEVGKGMIKSAEIDILAYNFPERLKNKDKISTDISEYFKNEVFFSEEKPDVLLILSELGTS